MELYSTAKELGVHAMWQLHLERSELQRQYLEQWHSHQGLDAIICPTTPYASVQNGLFKHVGYIFDTNLETSNEGKLRYQRRQRYKAAFKGNGRD